MLELSEGAKNVEILRLPVGRCMMDSFGQMRTTGRKSRQIGAARGAFRVNKIAADVKKKRQGKCLGQAGEKVEKGGWELLIISFKSELMICTKMQLKTSIQE